MADGAAHPRSCRDPVARGNALVAGSAAWVGDQDPRLGARLRRRCSPRTVPRMTVVPRFDVLQGAEHEAVALAALAGRRRSWSG